ISSPFQSPSRANRRVSSMPTCAHIHQLCPSTNCYKLSDNGEGSYPTDDDNVRVGAGLAQLDQRGVLGVMVPGLSLLHRRKFQNDDGARKLPLPFQDLHSAAAPRQELPTVFLNPCRRPREIVHCPSRIPHLDMSDDICCHVS